ncbi:MAG: hypothetical protein COC06_05435 [Bacteroidales bacterium]|nr:MAG: hypothetical protein COC06_05435 [Bacteroidales bacterium]
MKYYFLILILFLGTKIANAQQAEQLKTDAMNAELQEEYTQAADLFSKAINAFKAQQKTDSLSIFGAGQNYLKAKKYAEAIPFLKECTDLNYNMGRSARLLSNAYSWTKQYKLAEKILMDVAAKVPDEKIEFDKKLAYLYFNSSQYSKSASLFNQLLANSPNNKNYMYLYGFSLERIQKFDKALVIFEQMMQLYPQDKRAKKMQAYTYLKKTETAYNKEVKRYESIKNVTFEDFRETKKRLKNLDGDYEKARLLLEKAYKDYPKDKMLINALYKVYKKQKNTNKMNEMKKLI